jgi:predicted ATPase/class 3 adenylate cyclase
VAIPTRAPGAPGGTTGTASELAGYLAPTHLIWLDSEPARRWLTVDATFVFGDVSGFTALGERLARRGRVGSETLTEAITAVFSAMQAQVAARGGEILKFGGDAVLAMFAGEDHQRSAAAAALGMQEALGSLRIPGAPSAVRRLRMSVGVASGLADLFLAGHDPRDLIVAGPLASEVVAAEGLAEAGEVILSPATAAALPDECRADSGGRAGGLLAEAPPVAAAEPPVPAPGADPAPGLPAHMRSHEPDLGEHRTVTVAFLQFKGSDALLERHGPVALAKALDEIVEATGRACAEWGVAYVSSDVDRDGGKLILSAGAPVASPDDDDRMLHALRDVVGRDWPLAVRAGVNRGPTFSADIGLPERRVWSLMGDTVNLAARVMANAEPGNVLATPAVLRGVRDDFERTPVEPFKAKGKSAPVHAEAVGPASGARTADAPPETPLVGRERELGILRAGLDAARAGERRVIELVAEPGLGKSRLVGAVRDEAAGFNVLSIQGGPYAARTPYLAMQRGLREAVLPDLDDAADAAEPLRERVHELDPRLEPWLPLIGLPFGVEYPPTRETEELDAEFARARMAGALGRLIDVACPPQPMLVLIEDAHWLDGASLGLLQYLLGQARDQYSPDTAAGAGYVALITRRPGPSDLGEVEGIETIDLEPLDPDAVLELLAPRSADAATLPASLRRELVKRAQGNPLLLGELVAAAQAGGSLDELPDSVEALMNARMDTLPRGDRRLLREASVLGNEVSVELLAEVADQEVAAVEITLRGLTDFLVPVRPGAVRFSHALLHDAAYSALPFRRRRELHALAGTAIRRRGGEEVDEILAIHFGAAKWWPEIWHYARRAGEHAMQQAAPREAAGFFRSAVEAARWLKGVDSEALARTSTQLGEAAKLAGDFDQARKAYAKARKLVAGDAVAEAELLLKEGRLREGAASVSQALRYYTRGLDALGGERSRGATSVRARLILAQGATRLHGGKHRQALPLLEQAVREAERAQDRATLAHAYYLLDWCHTDLGNPEAERYRDLALPIFEELGDFDKQGRVLTNLGVNAYHEGRWDEALELYERARIASERAGDEIGASFNLNNVAEIRLEQGLLDEAEELLRDVLATWRASGFTYGIGNALRNLGRIEVRRGHLEQGGALLARGREALVRGGIEGEVCVLDAYEAKRLLLTGDHDAAKLMAEEIQDKARRIDVIPMLPAFLARIMGEAAVAAGRTDAGVELLTESVEIAERADAIYDQALGLDVLAEVTGDEEYRRRAAELFERLGVVAAPSTGVD